jgi:hypothetical protein
MGKKKERIFCAPFLVVYAINVRLFFGILPGEPATRQVKLQMK